MDRNTEMKRPHLVVEVKKVVPFPLRMNYELLDRWLETNRRMYDIERRYPATSLKELDLSSEGFGFIYVKDESDEAINPTKTVKDRIAREITSLHQDIALGFFLKLRAGTMQKADLSKERVPQFSVITSGNEGRALAHYAQIYGLAPPNLLVDAKLSPAIMAELEKLYANIYAVDLPAAKLSREDILRLTNNIGGYDITSGHVPKIDPNRHFYERLSMELFWGKPEDIYIPFGSGRTAVNILGFQEILIKEASDDPAWMQQDPHSVLGRIKLYPHELKSINIFAAEPEKQASMADKLTAPFKPFSPKPEDIRRLAKKHRTGPKSAIVKVEEKYIELALKYLREAHISAEPSGAAGLALYLQQVDHKERPPATPEHKVIVVNTGFGLAEPVVSQPLPQVA